MANWCYNRIAFYQDSPQENGGNALIEAFYADIQKYTSYVDTDGRKSDWLGNWLVANKIDVKSMRCRGSFIDCELYDDHVIATIETAWNPLPEVFGAIAAKYDLSYVYTSEECGREIYVNTDEFGRFFSTRYMLNAYDIEDLELDVDAEIMRRFGERLKEIVSDSKYFDSFDEVLYEFKGFGVDDVSDVEELNQRLEPLNIKVYEYSSE